MIVLCVTLVLFIMVQCSLQICCYSSYLFVYYICTFLLKFLFYSVLHANFFSVLFKAVKFKLKYSVCTFYVLLNWLLSVQCTSPLRV
jgi:hypothetical protein